MFYRKNKVKIRMKRKAWRACPFNVHFCGRRFTEGYIEKQRREYILLEDA